MIIYASKPRATHVVVERKNHYEVHRLIPGHGYKDAPPVWSNCGSKQTPSEAYDYADQCDENRIEPLRPA